jgi:hypothetical protein
MEQEIVTPTLEVEHIKKPIQEEGKERNEMRM